MSITVPINIVLAEDHRMVREGIRALLQTDPDFRIIGEASDGLEAMRLVDRLNPHVLITDLVMPGLSGLEVTRQLTRRLPQVKIVVISMHNKETYVATALQNGAAAFVLKDASAHDLLRAVHTVMAGKRFLSPPLSETVIAAYMQRVKETGKIDPYELLSSREREVLQMAAEGNTSGEIALRLFISPRTVETHRANIMRKLSLKSQSELVRFAIKHGILLVEKDEQNYSPSGS